MELQDVVVSESRAGSLESLTHTGERLRPHHPASQPRTHSRSPSLRFDPVSRLFYPPVAFIRKDYNCRFFFYAENTLRSCAEHLLPEDTDTIIVFTIITRVLGSVIQLVTWLIFRGTLTIHMDLNICIGIRYEVSSSLQLLSQVPLFFGLQIVVFFLSRDRRISFSFYTAIADLKSIMSWN